MVGEVTTIATFGTLAAAVATAIATFFLWRVTKVLADQTRKMAEASSKPQIIASLVPNQWSTMHFDLVIENTGNATAFDIIIEFDPPLENGKDRDGKKIPFQTISVLKPTQSLQSFLGNAGDYLEKSYAVKTTWLRAPNDEDREELTYSFDMGDYAGASYLGERDPAVQIATQVKNFREDWRAVAKGSKRVSADVYSSKDREEEALETEKWIKSVREKREKK